MNWFPTFNLKQTKKLNPRDKNYVENNSTSKSISERLVQLLSFHSLRSITI